MIRVIWGLVERIRAGKSLRPAMLTCSRSVVHNAVWRRLTTLSAKAFLVAWRHKGACVVKMQRIVRAHWMAAACVGVGLLAGCDSSADPAHAARKDAANAAYRVAGAGDLKPTEDLVKRVASGNEEKLSSAEYASMVKSAGAEKDLQEAIAKLRAAKGHGSLDKYLEYVIVAQTGNAQLELSIVQHIAVQQAVSELVEQAVALENVSQTAADFGGQAAALDNAVQEQAKQVAALKAASDKATGEVTAKQGAVADAQQKVKGIQDQMTSKDGQARKIYADTDAAFKAADAMKGSDAIAAGAKAMEDRKAAEALMEEIGNLEPQLRQAQGELALAQLALNDAQSLAKAADTAAKNGAEAADKTSQQAKDLHAAAMRAVNDPNGVKARQAAFAEAYGKLDAKIKEAESSANDAAASFASANGSLRTARNEAAALVSERGLEPTDPISKFAKDDRMGFIISWSQAASAEQAGRACLTGREIQTIARTAANVAEVALKSANESGSGKIADVDYSIAAKTHFDVALGLIGTLNGTPTQAGGDVDVLKWIGYSLEATAQVGAYHVNTQANGAALNNAKAAQAKAIAANPALASQLSWIAELK